MAVGLLPAPAHAVRPFVTDDARIISAGQLEMETWPELLRSEGRLHVGHHLMGGVSVNEWFELIVGGGVGLDPGPAVTVPNPVIQPKLLVWRAEDDGFPGLSVATGLTLPVGRGSMFDEATGFYVIAPITSRLFRDWLLVHANVGFTSAYAPDGLPTMGEGVFSMRPYWGFGLDVGVGHPDARLIVEAYDGDPFEALGPEYAFQWGGRWLKSDYVNLDLTFGAQPLVQDGVRVNGEWEMWVQVGIRLLFDVFTPDGLPGDPMGAHGMFAFPRFWR